MSPTWRSDGTRLGYVYGYGSLYGIPANPQPLEFGRRVIDPETSPGIEWSWLSSKSLSLMARRHLLVLEHPATQNDKEDRQP